MTMSYDDPHSFLFGLNQFATPSNNNSPRASGSSNNMNGPSTDNNSGNDNGLQQPTTSSLLNGLDVFAGGRAGDNNNDILDGGSFADQLELWTNANFSFDGPTGHALLGDEDKDKGDPDKKEDDKKEEKRAGKRAKNEGFNGGGPGKGRQRDEEENELRNAVPSEPTHQTHNDQAALQQQQHYFAPPSRNAEEARRPGYDQAFGAGQPMDRPRSESQSKSGIPLQPSGRTGVGSPSLGQATNNFSNPNFGNFNGPPQINGMATPHTPNGFPAAAQPGGQLDLTSLIALQQLVAQNPLALASLGSFAGLNPQLGALSAQLNGHNLQQLQQQMHQQQQNGTAQMSPLIQNQLQQQQQPFSQFNMGYQNAWPLLNGQFSNTAPIGSMAAQVPTPSAPFIHGNGQRDTNAIVTTSGSPEDPDDEDKRRKDRKKRLSSANGSEGQNDKSKPFLRDRKQSISEGDSSESGGTHSRMTASERRKLLEERAAERDHIPPLKLIDTGNPEADAEANRQAIEEDKRKRNTAASARFRIKKKQREAALEAHSKEVSTQLAELKDEVNKLRNENQWLKGLIQVRPGGGKDGIIPSSRLVNGGAQSAVSASEALAAAQQLQALQQAVNIQQQKPLSSSEPGKHVDRLRDTGIRPRGVGTDGQTATTANKRDREE